MRRFGLFVACGIGLITYDVISLDGLCGLLSSLVHDDCTVYARNYSATKFRRIRKGMTVDQVIDLLGEPIRFQTIRRDNLDVSDASWHGWSLEWEAKLIANPAILERLCYTASDPPDRSYRIRDVVFINGTVDHRRSEYYGD